MAAAMSRKRCGVQSASRIPHLLYAMASKRSHGTPLPALSQTCTLLGQTRPQIFPQQCRSASTLPSVSRSPRALPILSTTPKSTREARPSVSEPQLAHGRGLSPYLTATGLFGFAVALYISYTYTTYTQDLKDFHLKQTMQLLPPLPQDADVSNRYNDKGRDFDEEVERSEKVMFMRRKRMRVCREATGKVLEVSCGTGRNMSFYDLSPPNEGDRDRGIESITFNDKSAEMLEVARGKWETMIRQGRSLSWKEKERWAETEGRVHWVQGDVGLRGAVKRPEGGFDTIVQTMGICSVKDAAVALTVLGTLVRQPGEGIKQDEAIEDQGGKIHLLEHGRSYYGWLNRFLDNGASMHADHYGCWWNKDIGKVVQESGLKIESIRRYHLGTTWEVVLRPTPRLK